MYVYVFVYNERFFSLVFCHRANIQFQYLTVRIPDAMRAKENITNQNLNQKKMRQQEQQ